MAPKFPACAPKESRMTDAHLQKDLRTGAKEEKSMQLKIKRGKSHTLSYYSQQILLNFISLMDRNVVQVYVVQVYLMKVH